MLENAGKIEVHHVYPQPLAQLPGIQPATVEAGRMIANDAQAGLAQPPAHPASPGHSPDVRYGLRVVGAGIGPVIVQPTQL